MPETCCTLSAAQSPGRLGHRRRGTHRARSLDGHDRRAQRGRAVCGSDRSRALPLPGWPTFAWRGIWPIWTPSSTCLRSPHVADGDTQLAFQAVSGILTKRDVGRTVGRISGSRNCRSTSWGRLACARAWSGRQPKMPGGSAVKVAGRTPCSTSGSATQHDEPLVCDFGRGEGLEDKDQHHRVRVHPAELMDCPASPMPRLRANH